MKQIRLAPAHLEDKRGCVVTMPVNGTVGTGKGKDKQFAVRVDSNGFAWMAVDDFEGKLYFNRASDNAKGKSLQKLVLEHAEIYGDDNIVWLETPEEFANWLKE